MLQRGEAPARADVLVGRVPAVVAVVQWEGRVQMYLGFEFVVVVVPVAQMPNHSLGSCAKAYANNEGRGRRSEGRQRKHPHGFMRSRTTQILWICLHPQLFHQFETERNSKAQMKGVCSPQEQQDHHEHSSAVPARPQLDLSLQMHGR